MRSDADLRRLWTGWLNYGATGEGQTVTAYICYATSESQMRELISERHGSWFAENCEVAQGVVSNEVTRYLWSEAALTNFDRVGTLRGKLEAYSKVHINFS